MKKIIFLLFITVINCFAVVQAQNINSTVSNVNNDSIVTSNQSETLDSTASHISNDSTVQSVVNIENSQSPITPAMQPVAVKVKYGYCSRQQIIENMSEYAQVLKKLETLRAQYEKEANYNETDFRRQFQEYLEGQKEFPEAILLKRQHDLQESMEKGVAFRTQADSLLRQAEQDLMSPLRNRVDAAIQTIGQERGYEYVIDTDLMAFPYLNATLSEDITKFVEEKLK